MGRCVGRRPAGCGLLSKPMWPSCPLLIQPQALACSQSDAETREEAVDTVLFLSLSLSLSPSLNLLLQASRVRTSTFASEKRRVPVSSANMQVPLRAQPYSTRSVIANPYVLLSGVGRVCGGGLGCAARSSHLSEPLVLLRGLTNQSTCEYFRPRPFTAVWAVLFASAIQTICAIETPGGDDDRQYPQFNPNPHSQSCNSEQISPLN